MSEKGKCECNGTGFIGDNGPGIRGNTEYVPCDCELGNGALKKQQAALDRRAVEAAAYAVESQLMKFTDGYFAKGYKDYQIKRLCINIAEALVATVRKSDKEATNA